MNDTPCDPPPEDKHGLGTGTTDLAIRLGKLSEQEQGLLLLADQFQRWQRGDRVRVEAYLQRLPGLCHSPDVLLELIYNEVILREENGEGPHLDEYLERFPDIANQLHRQFSVHAAFQGGLPLDALLAAMPTPDDNEKHLPLDQQSTRSWGGVATPATETEGLPQVAGYELLGVLGRGGMGIVYKARQLGLGRLVALKMILGEVRAGSSRLERFRVEAEAVAGLRHPNIIGIYEVGEQGGRPFFSLEYIGGGSLDRKIAGTPQPPEDAATLVETLARAMQEAHQRGIIHRDLKPANILLQRLAVENTERKEENKEDAKNHLLAAAPTGFSAADYLPKITDFGLAKRIEDPGLTHTGDVMGTPSYMAPEQAAGRTHEIGPPADIYALGAILYELLVGRPPFKTATLFDTLHLVLHEEPVPPRRLQPKVPRDLETICLKCLQKTQRRRYASALALAEDLRHFLNGEPIQARPVGLVERAVKWTRRHPAWTAFWVTTAAALVCLSAGIFNSVRLSYQAEVAQARAAQREAEEAQRLMQVRLRVKQCVLDGQHAQTNGDLPAARKQAEEARALLENEPILADMRDEVQRLVAEVERRETVRKHYHDLFALRDEALFHLFRQINPAAELLDSLESARSNARQARELFKVPLDADQPFVLDDLYSPLEKAEIRRVCFEVLLIEAEAEAWPLPEQPATERHDRARTALKLLASAGRLLPDTRIAHQRREHYLRRLGDETAARREHELAQAREPATPLDAFLVGQDSFQQGRVYEAIGYFDRALEPPSDLFWAHFFRALAYTKLRLHAEARASLTVCIHQRPDFLWPYLLRGYLSGEVGARAAGEEDRLRRTLAAGTANPNELDTRRRAATAEKTSAFAAAETDLNRAAQLVRDDDARYVLFVNRGVLRLRQKRFGEAATELVKAIQLRPGQPQAYIDLANAYQEQKHLQAAVEQLDLALNRYDAGGPEVDQASLYRTRGLLQMKREQPQAALQDLHTAWQKEPEGDTLARACDCLECALIHYRRQEYEQAICACEAALRERADLVIAYRLEGLAWMKLGDPRSALLSLDRYVAGGVPVADIFRSRAHVHFELGQYAAAADDYTRALTVAPQDATLYGARGWVYLANDVPRLALSDFDDAIRLDPAGADAYCGRGHARVLLARSPAALAAAIRDAGEAARRKPNDADVLLGAARICARAVGKLDAEIGSRTFEGSDLRARYQDRAVALLRAALETTGRKERSAFWAQHIAKDPALHPLQRSSAFRQLTLEFGRAAR